MQKDSSPEIVIAVLKKNMGQLMRKVQRQNAHNSATQLTVLRLKKQMFRDSLFRSTFKDLYPNEYQNVLDTIRAKSTGKNI